ncbi:MAG: hypothetical protein HYX68_07315 [Planctomycetes bacterium]|nr:hypothetical protein [Planctomycetota bacterium]
MAFGFPAYHTEEIDDLGHGAELRDSVIQAIQSLGWSIRDKSKRKVTAATSVNFWSWGERVIVEFFPDGGMSVTSSCALPTQCIDWGKNRANVRKLLDEVNNLAETGPTEGRDSA